MNEGFSRSILHHECASKKVRRQRHDICIYRIRHNYLYLLSFSGIGYNEEHLTEAFLVLHVRTSALLRRHVETAGLWSDGNAKNRYRSSGLPPNAYQSFYLQRVVSNEETF
uniref:Uncharacterized protein n=1 Tax=Peronospora matthiolae TaxID=2874970 RepID=A0AAV1UTA2_9STRA